MNVSVGGDPLTKHTMQPANPGVQFYALPRELHPGRTVSIDIDFNLTSQVRSNGDISGQFWHPQIWWDGIPTRDSYRVKLAPPDTDYKVVYSGRLNPSTGYYENSSVTTNFGFYFGS